MRVGRPSPPGQDTITTTTQRTAIASGSVGSAHERCSTRDGACRCIADRRSVRRRRRVRCSPQLVLVVDTGVFSAALSRRRRPALAAYVAALSGHQLFRQPQSCGRGFGGDLGFVSSAPRCDRDLDRCSARLGGRDLPTCARASSTRTASDRPLTAGVTPLIDPSSPISDRTGAKVSVVVPPIAFSSMLDRASGHRPRVRTRAIDREILRCPRWDSNPHALSDNGF